MALALLMCSASPTAQFDVSQGGGAGYAWWSGWSGGSFTLFAEPSVSWGQYGLGLNLSCAPTRVAKAGQTETFVPVTALGKTRFGPLEAGIGYAYVPGFASSSGQVAAGVSSFAWSLGAVIPLVEYGDYTVKLALQNVALTRLANYVNPTAAVILVYRASGKGSR
jgi:hypothetical protein